MSEKCEILLNICFNLKYREQYFRETKFWKSKIWESSIFKAFNCLNLGQ